MPCGYCSDSSKRIIFMVFKICGELALVGAIASIFIIAARAIAAEREAEQAAGRDYMYKIDDLASRARNQILTAEWNYDTNITKRNEESWLQMYVEIATDLKEYWKETMSYLWHEYDDLNLKRMFYKYSQMGTSALPEDLNHRHIQNIKNMKKNYAKATLCNYYDKQVCGLHIEPEITKIFATAEDSEELINYWSMWHKLAGTVSKRSFIEYIPLNNEAAKLNGYENAATWWLSKYEDTGIEDKLFKLWAEVRPLYMQLHAFIRRQLRLRYPEVVSERGPIPAHLLGNIETESWSNIYKRIRPYPERDEVNIEEALVQKNFTATKMFKVADNFFKSLNMSRVPNLFWKSSMLEKPNDGRTVICKPWAWDFYNGIDYRVRQCTELNADYLRSAHRLMGKVQYFIQYKDQPLIYKEGANPGFEEAIGDTIYLSVSTPKHLRSLGLMRDYPDDKESKINNLFRVALEKIPSLPFTYAMDQFRFSVFRDQTSNDDLNCHFWMFRETLQGIEPPVTRDERDFDAPAYYYVSDDVDYIRYYVANFLQFQFHEALCKLTGDYVPGDENFPLSECNIYNSGVAGNVLKKMLQMGSSKPWPDALEVITGSRYMDARPLLEYFKPLYEWLVEENGRTGEYVGWENSGVQYCTVDQREAMEDTVYKSNLQKFT